MRLVNAVVAAGLATALLAGSAGCRCGAVGGTTDAGMDSDLPGTDAGGATSDSGGDGGILPPFKTPTAIDLSGWTPCVDVGTMGFPPNPFVVDTGSPITILDTTIYGGSPAALTVDLVTFGMTYPVVDVALFDLYGTPPPGATGLVAGILGGDFLRDYVLALDYQGAWGYLLATVSGDPWVDAAVAASVVLPFQLLGGGTFSIPGDGTTDAPATRVLLTGVIEGQSVDVMLDTGASLSIADEGFFAGLGDPGRPMLGGVTVTMAGGPVDASISRLASLCLGTACVSGATVMMIPGSALTSGLSSEAGQTISLLIGGSFLRSFLTTVDYPDFELRLAPYTSSTHINANEWIGPGFSVRAATLGDFVVNDVYAGTPAEAAGIGPGDYIADLDGVPSSSFTLESFRLMLTSYAVGTPITLGIRMGPSVVPVMVTIADLLPAYP